jgi:prephenate dehydrogenase
MKRKPTVGIIGFGRFGKLMASHLAGDFHTRVCDPQQTAAADIAALRAEPSAFAAACGCEVVIPSVPISGFRQVLLEMRPHLKPGSLVIDVCSVKEEPIRWMLEILPPGVEILGTHPMFGPDSAADSLAGRKIVLCPVRIDHERFLAIKAGLGARGLVVIEATAEEHDREIAVSLALTHFIGRALAQFGAAGQRIDTEGYKRLLAILEVVEHDTWQLFEDMHRFNPSAAAVRSDFLHALQTVDARLGEREEPEAL